MFFLSLLCQIGPHLPELVLNKKGTHSLQTLISLINFSNEMNLIETFIKDKVKDLSKVSYLDIKNKLYYFPNSTITQLILCKK
jgi:hypothetical protein